MAIDINIHITSGITGLTEHETSILQALAGNVLPAQPVSAAPAPAKEAPVPAAEAPAPAEEEEAPAKPARKRTSRAKPKTEEAPASTGPAVLEDFSEDAAPEAEEPEADLLGGDEEEAPDAPEYTVADALAAATKVLREAGGRAKVSEALAQTKAAKVSALDGDDIAAFLTALEA